MTDVNWSVPLATNLFPQNINAQIAQGPKPLDLAAAVNAYYKGKDYGYEDRVRNAFPDGLPRNPDGSIDWAQGYDTLLKTQGAAGFGAAVAGRNADLQQQIINQPQPSMYGPASYYGPRGQGAGDQSIDDYNDKSLSPAQRVGVSALPAGSQPKTDVAFPPSTSGNGANAVVEQPRGSVGGTTDQGLTPSQIQQANPGGIPPAVQQPTPAQTVAARFPQGVQVAQNGPQSSVAPMPQQQPQQVQQPGMVVPPPSPEEIRAQQLADYYQKRAEGLGLTKDSAAASKADVANFQRYSKLAEDLRNARLKNAEITPEQKNARDAAAQQAPVGMEANKEAAKGFYGEKGDYATTVKLARSAADLGQEARLAKNLTLQSGFYSGPLHEGMQTYEQFKAIFGENPSSALPMEAFHKVTNDMLGSAIKAMGQSGVGRVLQAEVRIMQQGIASLGITAVTNRAQLEMASRIFDQQQRFGQLADEVRSDPRVAPQDKSAVLNQRIAQWQQDHQLFSPVEKMHPELLGAPDAPPQAQGWSPEQKRAWGESIGLKPGDSIRVNGQVTRPDGTLITIP
jgi:hypothetical protein